jgi:hypothetical protein
MWKYLIRQFESGSAYRAVYERHFRYLWRMVFLHQIEAFEGFLKGLAAACIDSLAPYLQEESRYKSFSVIPNAVVAYTSANGSVGAALAESLIWLNNVDVNDRFRELLRDPFGDNWSQWLFPASGQNPAAERERAKTMSLLWQLRHTMVHNLGIVTVADGLKLARVVERRVPHRIRLSPTDSDVNYVDRFLLQTAQSLNQRVGTRVAEILTKVHDLDTSTFDPQEVADKISRRFATSVEVAGVLGRL